MSNSRTPTSTVAQARKDRGIPTVKLEDLPIAAIAGAQVIEIVSSSWDQGKGGCIVTANTDFLARARADYAMRQLYAEADLIVADGMPLIWAAFLRGTPIPERIAGSDLVWRLAEAAAREGRSLYLLGGAGDAGRRAADVLRSCWPEIRVAGWSSPDISSPVTAAELVPIREELRKQRPDLVFVAFGSPKQEYLMRALREYVPDAWMLGCGFSLSFIAGDLSRAPRWMQRAGFEWLHRLSLDPWRMFPRYILRDLPYTFGLLIRSLRSRRTKTSVTSK